MSCSQKYDLFIGRWRVFHEGHKAMIREVFAKNRRSVWVMVMDTDESPSAYTRTGDIREWLHKNDIPGVVSVGMPIASVNYGRGVGYEINQVHLPEHIEAVSATKLIEEREEHLRQVRDLEHLLPM